jgi:hypothetical protein
MLLQPFFLIISPSPAVAPSLHKRQFAAKGEPEENEEPLDCNTARVESAQVGQGCKAGQWPIVHIIQPDL